MMQRLNNNRGSAMPFAIAITLSVLFIMCGTFEYMKLLIITAGIRNAVQSAVIAVVVENYDNTYSALREGYSGGYGLTDDGWREQIDCGDIYTRLDSLLGLADDGEYHTKYIGGHDMEYRLSDLTVAVQNAPLAPDGGANELTVLSTVKVEIPVRFLNKTLPPLKLDLSISAAFTPKF